IKAGAFDQAAWQAAVAEANASNFDQVLAAIEKQPRTYAELIGGFSDADFRGEIDLFGGGKTSPGAVIVNMCLGWLAGYRTQLFLYLKSGRRDEFNTMKLRGGVDGPMPAA